MTATTSCQSSLIERLPTCGPWLPLTKELLLCLFSITDSFMHGDLASQQTHDWMRTDLPIQTIIWGSPQRTPWYLHLLEHSQRISVLSAVTALAGEGHDGSGLAALLRRACASFHEASDSVAAIETDLMRLLLNACFAPCTPPSHSLSPFFSELFDCYVQASSSKAPSLGELDLCCLCNLLWRNPLCLDLLDFAVDYQHIMGDEGFIPYFLGQDALPLHRGAFVSLALPMSRARTSHHRLTLPNQTGGHVDRFFQAGDAWIRKLTCQLEADFYMLSKDASQVLRPVLAFLPTVAEVAANPASTSSGTRFAVTIEDLTRDYASPCVLDLKVGTSSVGPDITNPHKLAQQGSRDALSTSASLGLRIVGFLTRATPPAAADASYCSKSHGRSVSVVQFHRAIASFFGVGPALLPFQRQLLEAVRDELGRLIAVLEQWRVLEFYSTSLLITFDASARVPNFRLKMIDFGHWFHVKEGQSPQDGYLVGLKNLLIVLQFILNSDGISSDHSPEYIQRANHS